MTRLYEKNPLRHFLAWLAIYLISSIVAINIGINAGVSAHTAAVIPLGVLSVILFIYLLRTRIGTRIGLGVRPRVPASRMWFYLPLFILVCIPFARGLRGDLTLLLVATIITHYVFVGFLEEVLFRGMLLHALLDRGKAIWAVGITAVTFGIGHVTSMLIGQGGTDTALQIINAIIIGLILTLVVFLTGSLHVVIVIHVLYNISATLTTDSASTTEGLIPILAGLAVLIIYGIWLLYGAGALTRFREFPPARQSTAPGSAPEHTPGSD